VSHQEPKDFTDWWKEYQSCARCSANPRTAALRAWNFQQAKMNAHRAGPTQLRGAPKESPELLPRQFDDAKPLMLGHSAMIGLVENG
jgi:cephalosporin-C deacetylase-like acetyl esterase